MLEEYQRIPQLHYCILEAAISIIHENEYLSIHLKKRWNGLFTGNKIALDTLCEGFFRNFNKKEIFVSNSYKMQT